MQVIITKNVPGIGYAGDTKNVKPGFFRNFLFPNKIARLATTTALKKYEAMKDEILKSKEEILERADQTMKKIDGLKIQFRVKASDRGTLYGSISEDDVIKKVKDNAKIELEKSIVSLDGGHIKSVGEYSATVRLSEKHKASIIIKVQGLED